MNHFHRVIFNPSLGVRQVVSEIASSGRCASGTVSSTGTGLSQAPRLFALAAACLLAWYPAPQALAASCDAGTPAEYIACVTNAGIGDTVNLTDNIISNPTTNLNEFASKDLIINSGLYTLTISRSSNLGSNNLVFDGGTLHQAVNPPAISLGYSRSIILNPGGGTLQADSLIQISGPITGAGGLTKTGTGDLVLSEDNTYAGPTTISEGKLWVGINNIYGSLGGGDVTNNAWLVFRRSDTTTVANNISGTGRVDKQGDGTLILTGNNSYEGVTVIGSGTLQIGSGGTSGTLGTGLVTLYPNAALVFNRSDTVTAGNNINGPGSLEKQGAGTLILSGANTYTGGTTITQGTLQVGDGSTNGFITGDVINNGTLAFNRTDAMGFSGTISGSGGVRQDGTGTLTLSGNNSYLGGTRIEHGTVSVSSNTNLGDITGNLFIGQGATLQTTGDIAMSRDTTINDSTISTNTNTTLTHNGVIAGTNGLTKTGAGTLILSGANTYDGGTYVNAGVLSVNADNNLGALSAALTLNGGTLQNTLPFTTGRTINFSGANPTLRTDADLTITSDLPNVGRLVKTGAASLILTGDVRTGNYATISAGTLQIGNGGSSGSLQARIFTNAELTFNRSDNALDMEGDIGGSGNVRQAGTGTVTLSGDNTYSGSTTISAGTLQIGNGGTTGTLGTGAVTNNAALAFNRSDAYAAANSISGTGTLTQAGAGNLILTGANTYAGATSVNSGTLSVNGSITSDTTVNSGGVLGGSGSVGNVNIASGGVLAPGNSIGTLTVNGNLTFAPGSIYRVETDAAGNADRVNVVGAPGTLIINGGTVDVQAGAGNYARNTSYTILTSTGATTGAFTGVTSNLAFLTPSLSYLPNGVTLNLLAGNAPVYNTVAQTPNQTSVANYLSSFANTPGNAGAAALIQQIDNLTAEQARTAFDSMSGSPHAAASQIAGALGRNFSSTLATRNGSTGSIGLSNSGSSTVGLKAPQYAALSPALLTRPGDVVSDSPLRVSASDPSGEPQDRPTLQSVGGLWGQAMGTGGRTGSDGNGPSSRYRANGFVFGYDQPITSNWLAGAALAYNKTQWDASTNGVAPASGSINSPQAGLYARYTDGPWQVRLDGTYSDHRFSTDRTITIGNASSIARSSHGGTEWALAAQAEYSLPSGNWDIRPLAGLRHARLSEAGFTETGAGAASLTVDARRTQNTVASLGVKLAKPLGDQGGKLQLSAIASHLMGDNDSPLSSRLAGQAASFNTAGTPLKRTALTLGTTLTGQLARALSAYADAAYEYRGAGQNAFLFTAGLRMSW